MGANDAADLPHQRFGQIQSIPEVVLDGLHFAQAGGVAGNRGKIRTDAAQFLDLLEQGHIGTGQAAGLAGHGYLALLDGDEGLDAQHPARDGHGGRQTAALAQILQIVNGGNQMQMLLGMLQSGGNLHQRLACVPQLYGQAHQQRFAQTHVGTVHKQHVVHIGKVCSQLCALPCAGQLVGQEDAQHFVPGSSGFQIELLEQFRAGLAGGGQLAAGSQMVIVGAGGHVDAVPQDDAVLQRHVQRNHGHAQLLCLGRQDVGRRIGKNADHKKYLRISGE